MRPGTASNLSAAASIGAGASSGAGASIGAGAGSGAGASIDPGADIGGYPRVALVTLANAHGEKMQFQVSRRAGWPSGYDAFRYVTSMTHR